MLNKILKTHLGFLRKKNFEYPNKIQFNQEISLEHLFSYNFTFNAYLVMEKETPEMQFWTGVTTHSHLEGKLIYYTLSINIYICT